VEVLENKLSSLNYKCTSKLFNQVNHKTKVTFCNPLQMESKAFVWDLTMRAQERIKITWHRIMAKIRLITLWKKVTKYLKGSIYRVWLTTKADFCDSNTSHSSRSREVDLHRMGSKSTITYSTFKLWGKWKTKARRGNKFLGHRGSQDFHFRYSLKSTI
jgi:hypothetical protein